MSPELEKLLDDALRHVRALSPQQYEDMLRAQRESFVRAMGPCEHGVRDWEDCPRCREIYRDEGGVA